VLRSTIKPVSELMTHVASVVDKDCPSDKETTASPV